MLLQPSHSLPPSMRIPQRQHQPPQQRPQRMQRDQASCLTRDVVSDGRESSKEAAGRSRIIFSWGGNSRGNGAEANPPPLSPPKNPKHTVSTRDFFSTRSLRTRGVYVSLS